MIRALAIALPLLGALMLIQFAGCGNDSVQPYNNNAPPPPSAPPNTVSIANMSFAPGTLTVTRGTTVTWKNNDNIAHTSTSNSGVWDTGSIPPGGSTTTTFTTSGTFPYHCTVHPMMTGSIVVQ
jgi:plastocyanin